MRTKFKDYEDWLVETAGRSKGKGEATKQEKLAQDLPMEQIENWSFEDDKGSNNSGYYSLQAVLTHKGRSSNSGHYVGWVKQKGDIWLKCDDDEVSPVHEEDVLKLSGGGDWHTAYILLYAPRKLPKNRGNDQGPDSATPAAATDAPEKMET
jgi:ubiquitin carboxyl-terminal hydrolase 14